MTFTAKVLLLSAIIQHTVAVNTSNVDDVQRQLLAIRTTFVTVKQKIATLENELDSVKKAALSADGYCHVQSTDVCGPCVCRQDRRTLKDDDERDESMPTFIHFLVTTQSWLQLKTQQQFNYHTY